MTTIKDMPMISVEQKNRFREAALEVEKERDEAKRMLASACEYLSRVSVLVGAQDDEDPQTVVELVEGLVAENLQLSELLEAAGVDAKEIKAENAALKVERDALAAECEAWASMAVALANKHPVDSQTFDYMDDIRGTDWGKTLAARDARMKAEALSDYAENLGRDDARMMREAVEEYRQQAEEMGDD